jgi:hypothetical protein
LVNINKSLSILEAILRGLEAQIEKGRDDIIEISCEIFSNLTLKENPKAEKLELITFNSKEPKSAPYFEESKTIINFGKLKFVSHLVNLESTIMDFFIIFANLLKPSGKFLDENESMIFHP